MCAPPDDIWISNDCIGFSDVSGTSTTRPVVGVISAMVEKELGEKNFGSLKSRLNMKEKGIDARDCLTTELRCRVFWRGRQRTRRSLVFSPNGNFTQAYVIVLRAMRHYTNSRTVIQITKRCTSLVSWLILLSIKNMHVIPGLWVLDTLAPLIQK